MATGSGKTKVMALAVAWHYFNAVAEGRDDYARSFLILAPNIIVFERLRAGRIELPFHRAIKKVPFVDEAGQLVEPDAENAIKFERFIFDALPLAKISSAAAKSTPTTACS